MPSFSYPFNVVVPERPFDDKLRKASLIFARDAEVEATKIYTSLAERVGRESTKMLFWHIANQHAAQVAELNRAIEEETKRVADTFHEKRRKVAS
jgi:rubrerythrin